jgi:hypothetical protein
METFAFIAELISTISVIVSLIYLASKIRENTRSMRRAAEREITRDLNELSRYFIEMPDLTELYFRSQEQPQELTPSERFRLERLYAYIFSSFQSALAYHKDGHLGDESIKTYAKSIQPLFDQPIVSEWWEKEGQFTFGSKFHDDVLKSRVSKS